MGLYDLVSFKEQLTSSVVTDSVNEKIQELIQNISVIKTHIPLTQHQSFIVDDLITHCEMVVSSLTAVENTLNSHLNHLYQEIDQVTHELFSNNYNLEEKYNRDARFVREHWRVMVNSDVEAIIQQRIMLHTDWKYPALEIGCRDGEWTRLLVAADPLYIMDRNEDFLDSTAKQFPEEYQRRLRPYHLANHNLSMLPQNQFGFVFSWGYFNYVSLDTMKSYLTQILNVLRPGGVFMFSYNDGDSPGGAGMAEKMVRAYTPKSVLLALVEGLGFEVVSVADHGPAISWLEIKRPGELQTIKAHQVLGEIKRRKN